MTFSELYSGLSHDNIMAELDTVSARRWRGALGLSSDIITISLARERMEPWLFSAIHWYTASSSGIIWLITNLLKWKKRNRTFVNLKMNALFYSSRKMATYTVTDMYSNHCQIIVFLPIVHFDSSIRMYLSSVLEPWDFWHWNSFSLTYKSSCPCAWPCQTLWPFNKGWRCFRN